MDDKSVEKEIVKMEERLAPLRIERDRLRRIFESEQRQIARLATLHAEEEQLEREIAALKRRDFPGAPPPNKDAGGRQAQAHRRRRRDQRGDGLAPTGQSVLKFL